MNNNVNTTGTVIGQPTNVQPVMPQPVSAQPVNVQPVNSVNVANATQVVTPQPVNTVNVSAATPVVNPVPAVQSTVIPVNNVNALPQTEKKKDGVSTNTYLIVGFFVGFVLLAAGFLLVLLLTGTIGNRNRLTFSKTINDVGFTHVSTRYYKFDKDVFTQVDNVDTYTFESLTDEEYFIRFDKLINSETNGISEYGFGTQISRKGNVVTITSYNPNFFGDTKDDVIEDNTKEGFTQVK